eukprot:TRINITY_DN5674_c1_g1_i3.p1 TRINITY_DN5674_c1_g1~~TRINITY_DN5674_c1_g1_i3.p1  ORF type:complete len:397 (-),score=32.56 TRINITY_DN5674_c1_g1_i3:158-1348(-)
MVEMKKLVAVSIAVAAISLWIGADPLRLSPCSKFPNLQIKQVQLHDSSKTLSLDPASKLKSSQVFATLKGGVGPESLAFDSLGRGPYTGISDGRIIRWESSDVGWIDFAATAPNRTEECESRNSAAARPELEHICGRPLGMRFWKETGELFVADAYFGLAVVPPEGGAARKIADEAEGVPFRFTNDLDFDEHGNIYFTDSSSVFRRRHFMLSLLSGDDTGRLMKYDRKTGKITVLLRGLRFANGVAVSKDFSFLLVAETTNCRILRYWLKGPQTGSSEVFALLDGFPDNVRRNSVGDFWVALHCRRNFASDLMLSRKWLLRALLRLPLSMKQLHYLFTGGSKRATAIRLAENGKVLEVIEDLKGDTVTFISEIEERNGKIWMGSVIVPTVTVYPFH